MKTKMYAIIAGVMLLSFGTAEAKPADEKKEATISNFIENAVKYPQFAQEQKVEGVVNLVIEKNENQKLVIRQIWGSDPRLVKHVERQIKRNALKTAEYSKEDIGPRFVRIKFNLV
ncbi:MAG: hypothetical protein RBT19_13505 [Tenuifilaceae bacterium]|jgi:hypothetical protein|nr:hypothetical protein [Tenuifilaceae bacterium]